MAPGNAVNARCRTSAKLRKFKRLGWGSRCVGATLICRLEEEVLFDNG